jgi:hypothetical protein
MIVHFHPSVPAFRAGTEMEPYRLEARNFSPLFKRETAPASSPVPARRAPFFKYGGANHPIGGRIWRPTGL